LNEANSSGGGVMTSIGRAFGINPEQQEEGGQQGQELEKGGQERQVNRRTKKRSNYRKLGRRRRRLGSHCFTKVNKVLYDNLKVELSTFNHKMMAKGGQKSRAKSKPHVGLEPTTVRLDQS
jgi:hypothetical protein